MPKYLIQGAYSPQGLKGVLKEGGSKRREAAEQRGRSGLVDGRQWQRSRALANNSPDHARGG